MRSFAIIAGLVALVAASAPAPAKTVTVTQDVTVTSCAAVVTDCSEWDDAPVDPVVVTSTYWGDAPAAVTTATTWADAPAPTTVTPVKASTWADVPAPVASTVKPVASYNPSKPVAPATYTGSASKMAGAGVAGVVAMAALLL